MGSTKRMIEQMEQERLRKQEALLDAPDMLLNVVEKLDGISESLSDTLKQFQPAETTRIFLSHRSVDRRTVSQYKRALKICGFHPWIGTVEMPAGTHLDDAILNGMQESCAAVFFITPNFKDTGFLKQEIEYAIREERQRTSHFVIIPLLLDGTAVDDVPPLLQRFVAKNAANGLDGLLEIIKALPIKPGPSVSKFDL